MTSADKDFRDIFVNPFYKDNQFINTLNFMN